jgi:hypothetical protein
MSGKTFDQFYGELITESQRRPITMVDALKMAHQAGFEYGFENGIAGEDAKVEEPEATAHDAQALRLMMSTPDDSRLP